MNLDLNTPALLFPAVAIMMLGYVNRYISIAGVIRSFKKDYDSGYVHVDLVQQLRILNKRIELSRFMLTMAAAAMILSVLSMLLLYLDYYSAGAGSFAGALSLMILSLGASFYETSLSNKSLQIEIDDIFAKEEKTSRSPKK